MGAAPVSHGRRPLGARSGNEGVSARRVLPAAAAWEGVGVTSRPRSRLPQCGVFIMIHCASHGTEAGSARGRGPRAGGSDHAAPGHCPASSGCRGCRRGRPAQHGASAQGRRPHARCPRGGGRGPGLHGQRLSAGCGAASPARVLPVAGACPECLWLRPEAPSRPREGEGAVGRFSYSFSR